jgi:hypothetical protein
MTPMGVPVTVHMVVHVLIMIVEIIRRGELIPVKISFHAWIDESSIADVRVARQEEI